MACSFPFKLSMRQHPYVGVFELVSIQLWFFHLSISGIQRETPREDTVARPPLHVVLSGQVGSWGWFFRVAFHVLQPPHILHPENWLRHRLSDPTLADWSISCQHLAAPITRSNHSFFEKDFWSKEPAFTPSGWRGHWNPHRIPLVWTRGSRLQSLKCTMCRTWPSWFTTSLNSIQIKVLRTPLSLGTAWFWV